jgi:hypothetical protein
MRANRGILSQKIHIHTPDDSTIEASRGIPVIINDMFSCCRVFIHVNRAEVGLVNDLKAVHNLSVVSNVHVFAANAGNATLLLGIYISSSHKIAETWLAVILSTLSFSKLTFRAHGRDGLPK